MAIYNIVKYPDPVLLKRAEEVTAVGEKEKILIRDMIETMHAQKGVGLAANQIGISKRIFVASPDGKKGAELVFLNPRVTARSGFLSLEEGCLSIPEVYDTVRRSVRVTLEAIGPDGKPVRVKAEGLLARIFQHETDHLNGLLYIHRLGFFKRRRLARLIRSGG